MSCKISKKELNILFYTIPLLKPDYMNQIFWLDNIFNLWRILAFLFLLFFCFYRKKNISFPSIVIVVIEVYLLFNTLIRDGDVNSCLKSVFPVVGLVLVYDLFSDDFYSFVRAELLCYELLIYINFISMIIFPKGLYYTVSSKNWFLGYYNSHIQFFLPAIIFVLLYDGKFYFVRRISLISTIIASSIISWSGGSLGTTAIILVCYLLGFSITSLFNYYTYWMVQPLFFLAVVVNGRTSLIRWVIDDVLDKWDSLRGRMLIWNVECKSINHTLLLGNGVEYSIQRVRKYLGMAWAVHSHNFLLEMLHQGGFIYLGLFIVLIMVVGNRIIPYKNERIVKVLSLCFLGWAVRGTVDPCLQVSWVAFFVITYKYAFLLETSNRVDSRSK